MIDRLHSIWHAGFRNCVAADLVKPDVAPVQHYRLRTDLAFCSPVEELLESAVALFQSIEKASLNNLNRFV